MAFSNHAFPIKVFVEDENIEFGSDYTCPVAFMVFFNKKLKSEMVFKGTDKILNSYV